MLNSGLLFRRGVSPFAITLGCLIAASISFLQADTHRQTSSGLILLGVGLVSLWGWHRARQIWHFIIDTPLSKVETAAQGYVELRGKCDLYGDRQSQGFASGPPCIWQSYSISNRRNAVVDSGVSSDPFMLNDSTGICAIYPEGAIVLASERRSWREGDNRYSIRYIRPGATLYVLGAMRTIGGSNSRFNKGVEVSAVLAQWKQDPQFLMTEFDTDGDGKLDVDEWSSARARATTVVENLHADRCLAPVTHQISRPENGEPFVISDKDPAPLGRLFMALSWLNLGLALVALYSAADWLYR